MQCPQCGKEGLRFKEKNIRHRGKSGAARITYRKSQAVFCSKCGYQNIPPPSD